MSKTPELSSMPETSIEVWGGDIREVAEYTFIARLEKADTPIHEATFYKTAVRDEDQPLIEIGAVFTWTITKAGEVNTPDSLHSEISFMPFVAPTQEEIDTALEEARNLKAHLGWK